MFCSSCGSNNVDTASFCNGCGGSMTPAPSSLAATMPMEVPPGAAPGQASMGAPVSRGGQVPGPAYAIPPAGNIPPHNMAMAANQELRTGTSGMAIAGFVLSFFCGLLGLIFSLIGYNECRASDGRIGGEGLALAGIIISIISMLLGVMIVAAGG